MVLLSAAHHLTTRPGRGAEVTGAIIRLINPAEEERAEEVAVSSREDVGAAVEAARRGQREWRAVSGLQRAELFRGFSRPLRDHADGLAETTTPEGGRPLAENRDEVTRTAACFDYYGGIARDSVGYLPAPIEPGQLAMVIKEPIGVVACIVPRNYPLLLAARKVAPALAAGNAVIPKSSEETPLATRRTAELLESLPKVTLQVLYGAEDAGEALVRHPGVDMVAFFTGAQATGQKVACRRRVHRGYRRAETAPARESSLVRAAAECGHGRRQTPMGPRARFTSPAIPATLDPLPDRTPVNAAREITAVILPSLPRSGRMRA